MSKKTVVIVGASFGGLSVAKTLAGSEVDVVLIDKRDYFDLTFTSPRLIQDPHRVTEFTKPLSDLSYFTKLKFIQATVKEIHPDHAILDNGESVEFGYCVVASGSKYANEYCKSCGTASLEERKAAVQDVSSRVKQAKSILVIGGGLTGMEVAAESKEAGAESVTLVNSRTHLVDNKKHGKKPLQRLQKLGVEVILGTRPTLSGVEPADCGPATYEINGTDRSFDMVFKCVGFQTVHADFIGPLGDVLTPSGFIDVNPSFQVRGYTNIFAIGDAVDVDDTHLGYLAEQHGPLAAKAILLLVNNPSSKLPTWKANGGAKMNVVTLGKKNALILAFKSTTLSMVPGSMLEMKVKNSFPPLGFT